LDERYFLYFEDVEWCLQFWRHGWRVVYLPKVSCTHTWSRASRKGGMWGIVTNPLARRHLKSGLRFFRRNGLRCARPSTLSIGTDASAPALPTPRPADHDLLVERTAS
jgi:GT2 family glycosyltransferase